MQCRRETSPPRKRGLPFGGPAVIEAAHQAGCTFLATSPTPLNPHPSDADTTPEGLQTVQAADLTQAVRRCLDAAAGGARALAATAGPGLGACGETVGLAQMCEVPMVIVHCQYRAAANDDKNAEPITGDVDVTLARHLTPGSIPLPVLAATDTASAYQLTLRAFDIAERLQTPVLLLTSKDIALAPQDTDPPWSNLVESPLPQANGDEPRASARAASESGVWHQTAHDHVAALHAEHQTLLAEPARLQALLARLLHKVEHNPDLLEIVAPDPDPDAETLLISYGLADQAARRAVSKVRAAGARVSHLTIQSLWPIPEQAIRRAMTPFVRRVLVPELNTGLYAAELARLIKAVKIESIPRFDGGLIDPQTIARRVTDWPCG